MPEPSLAELERLEPYYAAPRIARASVAESVRRHLFLALLPILVLAGAALAYGLQRPPRYTAESRVSVGKIDLSQPGAITGFATATQALASAYSRAIDAPGVIAPVSRQLRLSPGTVLSKLNATPVPQAPLIRVIAVGPSRGAAVRLSNSGAAALTSYLNATNSAANPASRTLLRRYRAAQLSVARASLAADTARRVLRDSDTAANRATMAKRLSELQTRKLRAGTISTAYNQSQQGSSLTQFVSVLTRATQATSDRYRKLQIYVFGAVLTGALLGAALATARENRLRRA
jgi:uncharacterized protein involved in exopolysaccharide biosynthesis